ncbi:LPP20 family lipoprotein [Alphaproteobacteria bacterium]|nr:LPP20 family lipoprotein [Alphaproteobacteria bacterium]
MNKSTTTSMALIAGLGLLSACGHMTGMSQTSMMSGVGKDMAMVEASQSQSVVTLKDVLDAETNDIPTLTAIGYAVTSSQPGRSPAQKRLMAIRSARMAAMRDMAEQIHGLQVDSSTTVIDLMVQNDTFRGVVSGTIRGARTVRINPTGSETYEVVLEIDREMVGYLLKTARQEA